MPSLAWEPRVHGRMHDCRGTVAPLAGALRDGTHGPLIRRFVAADTVPEITLGVEQLVAVVPVEGDGHDDEAIISIACVMALSCARYHEQVLQLRVVLAWNTSIQRDLMISAPWALDFDDQPTVATETIQACTKPRVPCMFKADRLDEGASEIDVERSCVSLKRGTASHLPVGARLAYSVGLLQPQLVWRCPRGFPHDYWCIGCSDATHSPASP